MVVIVPDKKLKKVLLTSYEIEIIQEALKDQTYNLFTFLNCDEIIKKLKDALEKK